MHALAQIQAVQFGGGREQVHTPVIMHNGKPLNHRQAWQVGPAYVQKPAYAVRLGQDCGALAIGCQCRTQFAPLAGRAIACQIFGIGARGGGGRGRTVGPQRVNLVVHALQGYAAALQALFQRVDFIGRMKPWVKAHNTPRRQGVLQPRGRFGFWPVHGREIGGALQPGLHAVAPVDKQPCTVPQHDAKPRRPRESCQPCQPFITRGHIFALMGIGAGYDEPVHPVPLQRVAQGAQAGRAIFGAGGGGVTLEHGARTPVDACAQW